jgi:hypothetical protein
MRLLLTLIHRFAKKRRTERRPVNHYRRFFGQELQAKAVGLHGSEDECDEAVGQEDLERRDAFTESDGLDWGCG